MEEQPKLPVESPPSTTSIDSNISPRPATPTDPEILLRRERSLIEGILSNESLTEDLNDEDANEVIEWSIEMARASVRQTVGMEEPRAERVLSERMYTTRKVMRSVRRLVLEVEQLDEKTRSDLMDQIVVQTRVIYGEAGLGRPAPARDFQNPASPADDIHLGKNVARLRRALESRQYHGESSLLDNDVNSE